MMKALQQMLDDSKAKMETDTTPKKRDENTPHYMGKRVESPTSPPRANDIFYRSTHAVRDAWWLGVLFLLPCLAQSQSTYLRGDSTAVTTAQTQLALPNNTPISYAYIENRSSTQSIYIGMSLGSTTATPDTGSLKRIWLRPGSIWTLDRGVAPRIIWVRSRSGTVSIDYGIQ